MHFELLVNGNRVQVADRENGGLKYLSFATREEADAHVDKLVEEMAASFKPRGLLDIHLPHIRETIVIDEVSD